MKSEKTEAHALLLEILMSVRFLFTFRLRSLSEGHSSIVVPNIHECMLRSPVVEPRC